MPSKPSQQVAEQPQPLRQEAFCQNPEDPRLPRASPLSHVRPGSEEDQPKELLERLILASELRELQVKLSRMYGPRVIRA